jgi:hypothetical protein
MKTNWRLTLKNVIYVLALILLLNSCDELCTVGNNNYAIKKINLGDYHSISNPFSGSVHMKQGPSKVEVEAETNIIDKLEFNIEDKTLKIANIDNECLSPNNLKFTFFSQSYNGIENNGSADWLSDSLNFDPDILSNGSGDITLLGNSFEQTILINGSGDINLSGMKTKNAKVQINGSGDCFLTVSGDFEGLINGSGDVTIKGIMGTLKATINGSGDIYYSGVPGKIELTRNGSGNLIKKI